jgi:putative endonuclease
MNLYRMNYITKGDNMYSKTGSRGESLACQYLREKGWQEIERNYRRVHGEIDLIMKDGKTLVFVEVKARVSRAWGDPVEAVTPWKQKHIRYAASRYLYEKRLKNRPIRFDIVEVWLPPGRKARFHHIKNAF